MENIYISCSSDSPHPHHCRYGFLLHFFFLAVATYGSGQHCPPSSLPPRRSHRARHLNIVLTSFKALLFHPCSCINEDELLHPRTSSSLSALSFNSLRKTEASSGNIPKVWAISKRNLHHHQNGNHITCGKADNTNCPYIRDQISAVPSQRELAMHCLPLRFFRSHSQRARSGFEVCFINTGSTHAS